MEIHVAENGQSFGLDCQPSSTVEMLQSVLAPVTGMPVHDQMLMCGDQRLEPHRTLMWYKLPDESRHVFLFNRSRLVAGAACPPPEEFPAITVDYPPPPNAASMEGHPLNRVSDPAIKALPSYEIQFRYHCEEALAIAASSQLKFDACRTLLREQQVQELALETARGNMDFHYKIIDNVYSDFIKQYNKQYRQHSELLANLDRDLGRLRSCRLHPKLRTAQRETLLDCVKEVKVRKWAEHCAVSFKQFNGKVGDLKEGYAQVQRHVQALFYTAPAVNIRELIAAIEDHNRYMENQGSIIQSLSKDVNTVKKLVDDCISSQYAGSLRLHDAVSALEPMYDVHDKSHLPRMEACDRELENLLQLCQKSKNAMSKSVHTRLQSVAALQSNLRDIRNQLAVFKEAMTRQEENFAELKIIRRMGSAYKACLAEAVRRKAAMKIYMGQAGQLVETMARKREAEVLQREEFLKTQSIYFSRELLQAMGLYENPSQCVVKIEPFDMKVLDVDIADLERYAPESLVGPYLKVSSMVGRAGGLQALSDRENPGGPRTEDLGQEDEDCGDEILGTSKLEVENAWLRGELASAVARLCQWDPDLDLEDAGAVGESGREFRNADPKSIRVQKTMEALRLKDDHATQLNELLFKKQAQCQSYEERIRELEQRLQDQHLQMQKFSGTDGHSSHSQKDRDSDSESSVVTALRLMSPPEPMDEGVTSLAPHEEMMRGQSTSNDRAPEAQGDQSGHGKEGIDKTMSDVSGLVSAVDVATKEFSSEGKRADEALTHDTNSPLSQRGNDGEGGSGDNEQEVLDGHPGVGGHAADVGSGDTGEQVAALQQALRDKSAECAVMEERLRAALAETDLIHAKVDSKAELLSECQINCAHLENRLHEAREQAREYLCRADRRAVEYNAVRGSSVRLLALMERLRSCISSSDSAGLEESLRALVMALSTPIHGETGDDVQSRTSIKFLAETFAALAQQRAELLERCTTAENNQQVWRSRLRRSGDYL